VKKMNTEEKFETVVRENAHEIAEYLFAPSGQHIYVELNGTIHLQTASTKMVFNEPVLHFHCANDLDDIPAGEEVEAWEEWLLLSAIHQLADFIQEAGK